jgi:hypothetical protein
VPFLRVIRDKRGYETTYLMHWFREGSRQHSRILYVFRSPGGVRVGRTALEPDVLRQLETRHPEIAFDWAAVLDNRQVIETAPPERRPRKRRRGDEESGAPAAAPARPEPQQASTPRFVVPATLEGDTPEAQIAFLSHWHGLIKEQIAQRAADPARRDALLALAARLDPSAWTDADEVTTGLQQAAEALERLSHVFAKRRRRTRRKKSGTDAVLSTTDSVLPETDTVLTGDESDSTDDAQPVSTDAATPVSTDPDPPTPE